MVVAFVGIALGNAEGEKGERQQFESVLEGSSVGDCWKERSFLLSFLVGR
jgi:hypothetical protein